MGVVVERLLLVERLLFERILLKYFYYATETGNTFSERRPQNLF